MNLPDGVSAADAVVFNDKLKVFTMKFTEAVKIEDYKNNEDTLELIADPSSFKKAGGDVFKFNAILNGLDPRKLGASQYDLRLDNQVQVSCTLDLSI